MHEIILRAPDDFHVHFRLEPGLPLYVRRTAQFFERALPMPNTVPPIADAESLKAYLFSIRKAAPGLMLVPSIKLLPGMRADTVRACASEGALVGKYYPAGVTTNAQDGIRSPEDIREALLAMEELGMILSIHGEEPSASVLDRERAFLPTVERILSEYPRLRVVLEHLSTKAAAAFVLSGPERLGGTITAHHLTYTVDDLMGGSFNPHLFCKPILQGVSDRAALREAALSGSGHIFFGSDSAPHPRSGKESGKAPAGIYSAPVALSLLAAVFEEEGALDRLEFFTSEAGASFYGLPPNQGRMRFVKEPWAVPGEMDGVVPAAAGQTLVWKAERV
jgi:dihydroorotase